MAHKDESDAYSLELLSSKSLIASTVIVFLVVQILLSTAQVYSDSSTTSKSFQLSLPPLLGILAVLIGLVLGHRRVQRPIRRGLWGLAALLSAAIMLNSIAVEVPFSDIPNELWEGFGSGVAVVCLLLTLLSAALTSLSSFANQSRRVRWALFAFCSTVYLAYLPTFLQPPGGIININDTTYHVIDEMLAPLSGELPHSTYMPTYTAMFGWIFAPLHFLHLNPSHVMLLVIIGANCFFFSIPILIALTIRRLEPRAPLFLLPLFVVPFFGIAGRMNGASTILSGFSTFGRFFFPFLTLCVGVYAMTSQELSRERSGYFLFGLLTSVTLFNNADFCFSFVIATVLALSIASVFRQVQSRNLVMYALGLFVSSVTYLLVLEFAGRGFDVRMYSSLVLLGQKGDLYFYEMAKFGPHILVFISAVAATALGLANFMKVRGSSPTKWALAVNVALLQSGLWTLALLMMFAVRPIIPFATQQLLTPAIANFMLIAVVAFKSERAVHARPPLYRMMMRLPLTLILCLPIAAVAQAPNPIDEAIRVSGHARHSDWSSTQGRAPADGWTPEILKQQGTLHHPGPWLEAIESFATQYKGNLKDVGYFGYMGNTVQLITGIRNVMGVSGPEHMRFGPYFESRGCMPIDRIKPKIVLVYASPVPCPGLVFLDRDETGILEIYLVRSSTESQG